MIARLLAFTLATGAIAALVAQFAILIDLFDFEYRPLLSFLGLRGIAAILVVNAGLIVVAHRSIGHLAGRATPSSAKGHIILALSAITVLWMLEWIFIEKPPSYRIQQRFAGQHSLVLPSSVRTDLDTFSLSQFVTDAASREALDVMYERIRLVNPAINREHPIGQTIDRYATRYRVAPEVLFYLAYVHSFWGEATSGRVPFLGAMTAETIRDLVQIHLPAWFVESELRHYLITSDFLQRIAGHSLGFKLRYAVHKATLDVSAQPYELNMLSDVLLVLNEYPQEFADVLGDNVTDPVKRALRDAFKNIGRHALERPYEDPYSITEKDPHYYEASRRDLKRFARAAYYATSQDFDLATRVATLLVDYQRNIYVQTLGPAVWNALPLYQQAAMLVMTRDVYAPSIGRPAYNVYALPEMNCMPVAFVSSRAGAASDLVASSATKLWRPIDYDLLWGGAGTKLRVFSEVWSVVHGYPAPGLEPENSVPYSRTVVGTQQAP